MNFRLIALTSLSVFSVASFGLAPPASAHGDAKDEKEMKGSCADCNDGKDKAACKKCHKGKQCHCDDNKGMAKKSDEVEGSVGKESGESHETPGEAKAEKK